MREWRGWREVLRQWTRAAAAVLLLVAAVDGCSGSGSGGGGSVNIANSQSTDPATVNYPIFYVKRTVPTDTAGNLVQDDLRVMRDLVPQVDLYERASASPSALETNITSRITAGALYDVKDVDVSADGGTVLFAMRGPLTMNQQSKNPPCWRIWQYVIATDTLSPVIDPSIDPDPRPSTTSRRTSCRTGASCSRAPARPSRRAYCSTRGSRSSPTRTRRGSSRRSCSR